MEDKSLKYATSLKLTKSQSSDMTTSTEFAIKAQKRVDRKKSKAVGKQAIAYMVALLVPYTMDTIYQLVPTTSNYIFEYFAWAVFPLQGFFNFLIFSSNRKGAMRTPEGRFLRWLLLESWSSLCARNPDKGTVAVSSAADAIRISEASNLNFDTEENDGTPVIKGDEEEEGKVAD